MHTYLDEAQSLARQEDGTMALYWAYANGIRSNGTVDLTLGGSSSWAFYFCSASQRSIGIIYSALSDTYPLMAPVGDGTCSRESIAGVGSLPDSSTVMAIYGGQPDCDAPTGSSQDQFYIENYIAGQENTYTVVVGDNEAFAMTGTNGTTVSSYTVIDPCVP
ncbi:MAG: hypothetical protein AB2A00_02250 [Myxococcota bacterium]